jgi:TatD DNase family protein
MIIDSHAHYAHPRFDTETPCLGRENQEWSIFRAQREELLQELRRQGIAGVVEPSIGFDAIGGQLALAEAQRPFFHAAVGVHPTRCIHTPWKNRREVSRLAENTPLVAIGEAGLDYHHPRRDQHRLRQKRWFIYQIKLADELGLPLILHIRAADEDGLRILNRYRNRLHGGVAHCFVGDYRTAERYIALGLTIGIGGKLLCDDEEGRTLCETVRRVPLSAILVETDAPYVLPDLGDTPCGKHQRRKLCNTSLILPAVIRRIAELRGEPCGEVEETIFQNTLRVFGLPAPTDKPRGDA